MQESLLDMRDTSTKMGAEFVVLLFPSREEIYWNIARQFAPGKENLDVDHPLNVIRDFCQQNNIKYCELADDLRAEAGKGRQLYHRISQHWNDNGNEVAAKVVQRCLDQQGLLAVARGASNGAPAALAGVPGDGR